jgi:pimeloyl-ACP methyl ester carboxylesterase
MPKLITGENTLNFLSMGQGEPVIMIHGLGANLAFWYMGIARPLTHQYQVVSYDLRGHGGSSMSPAGYTLVHMAADLKALLDHLNLERAHLVGHSYGARVALFFSLLHPDRVRTLTLADTQIESLQPRLTLREWPYWEQWKQTLRSQGYASLPADDEIISFELLQHFNQLSANFTQGGLQGAAHRPSLRHRDMGIRGAARWRRLMNTTSARTEFADESRLVPEEIKRLKASTLAVYGEYSHCLASCHRLKELLPECEVRIQPGAGHFHPAIKPRLFVRSLLMFLNRHRRDRVEEFHWCGRERRRFNGVVHFPLVDNFGANVLFDRRRRSGDTDWMSYAHGHQNELT